MGIGYQFSDRRSHDYELWYSNDLNMPLRGPRTAFDSQSPFWSFVGAAQTFGRFAELPFPALISAWGHKPHYNLGFAGAGPSFFANSTSLIQKINQSELCFLQIMSGRSVSTRLLRAIGYGGMLEFLRGPLKGQKFLAAKAYQKLLECYSEHDLEEQLHDAREKWKEGYRTLIEAIKVPTICIWVSNRDWRAHPNAVGPKDVLGDFPHLITPKEMTVFSQYGLEIVGERLKQKPEQMLLNFSTGKPVEIYNSKQFPTRSDWSRSFNTYYPTPGMHLSIAADVIAHLAKNGDRSLGHKRHWRNFAGLARLALGSVLTQENVRRRLRPIYKSIKGLPVIGENVSRLKSFILPRHDKE